MGKKILIIDDEDDFRSIMIDRLIHEGFDIVQAIDGVEGVEVARQEKPDLILLDIMMPAMSGYQVWSRLQKDPELSQIPVLILSAKLQATDVFWGDRMPSADYLIKSNTLEAITERIREKLEKGVLTEETEKA